MDNQKLENLLNLSLDSTPTERQKSMVLNTGYNLEENTWTLIVKYLNNLDFLNEYQITPTYLLGNYAIINIAQPLIPMISSHPNIIYIEKPKNLYFSVLQGRAASCISSIQNQFSETGLAENSLYGEGCLIGIIDSGIDYQNDVFRNADGSSRIVGIWDQTLIGNAPDGYAMGTYYNKEEINFALTSSNALKNVPSQDFSGHGTAVASIAAGNFSPNKNSPLGIAPRSELLVVKIGTPSKNSFPRTSELMQAVDFCVKKALELNKPLALNLSFGNNYGSHTGSSLLETYIDTAATFGRTSICIGMGNEGNSANHFSADLSATPNSVCELYIAPFETGLNVQIWKPYVTTASIQIEAPSGEVFSIPDNKASSYRFFASQTNLLLYYGEPAPYSIYQEIYIDFLPTQTYLSQGIWKFYFEEMSDNNTTFDTTLTNNILHLWLPVNASLNGSQFLAPVPYSTLTIPSTAGRAISVAAYDSYRNAFADFSGRGSFYFQTLKKPEIAAPGVNISCAAVGGGFVSNTGTSMATPFVTGSAALLMEWGIIKNNDPFLYGEKLKAFLIKGAKSIAGFSEYPNSYVGWGKLCVADSIPK